MITEKRRLHIERLANLCKEKAAVRRLENAHLYQKYPCNVCGKDISYNAKFHGSGKCSNCNCHARKGIPLSIEKRQQISKTLMGKLVGPLNPNWKGGKENNKHYCIDCGAENNKWTVRKVNLRCQKCYLIWNKGSNNPRWNGGSSFQPYSLDWTRTLRRSIRERDKYTCRVCGEQQSDRAFDIHHIDYNKNNCDPLNLITLCKKCHPVTNSDREYWQEKLSSLLKENTHAQVNAG